MCVVVLAGILCSVFTTDNHHHVVFVCCRTKCSRTYNSESEVRDKIRERMTDRDAAEDQTERRSDG